MHTIEPSSVLGSKILRAVDNPSPPPQFTDLPTDSDEEEEQHSGAPFFESSSTSISARVLPEDGMHVTSLITGDQPPHDGHIRDDGRGSPVDHDMLSPRTATTILKSDDTYSGTNQQEITAVNTPALEEDTGMEGSEGTTDHMVAQSMLVDDVSELSVVSYLFLFVWSVCNPNFQLPSPGR